MTTSPEELSPVKRALVELRDMRAKLDALERQRTDPIAIVGLGCRFPGGVRDASSYWELLRGGVDAIQEIPGNRWDVDAYYDPAVGAPGKMATRWGGFLDQVDQFDADFFNISPREAATMDPQQRLLLEVAWEALENAGQAHSGLAGSATGVFVGLSTSDYAHLQVQHGAITDIDAYFGTGGAHSVLVGRLSYVLGLRGPSVAVDTACSSSLVAIHLACQSLRTRECRMALAGGVNVILLPELTIALSKARMMAPDGRCKVFDAAADGFVRAEGCGVIVLKRLSDAVADGDRVLALIRGSAVNQDGRSNGLTAPNGPSQEQVIQAALEMGDVAPERVSYVEAHGTGTALGDPIEAQALAAAYGGNRSPHEPLRIGSVKTQLGHLEAAAGVAGLMKIVLALQHNELPANLHFRTLNPHIAAEHLPLEVVSAVQQWAVTGTPRLAGVSSFGFGGTNAHVVVEEAPNVVPTDALPVRPGELLTVSARTPTALHELCRSYAARLDAAELADVCYAANTGRAAFDHRVAVVASSAAEMRARLMGFAQSGSADDVYKGHCQSSDVPGVVFLFTGQGSQYSGMGQGLYRAEPVFKDAIDRCAEILRPLLDRPLTDILFDASASPVLLEETIYAQPALFALEYAVTELWKSWGVEPAAVIGHSLGECVAACVAGVFSLEDGLKLVAERARLMQALAENGDMVTVFADEAVVTEAIAGDEGDVSIAAVNAPAAVVISGRREAVAKVIERLRAKGVRVRDLGASRAFHSPLMDPMLDAFESVARQVTYREPRITFVSNVSGAAAADGEVSTAAYWRRQARHIVRFRAGLDALTARGHRLFVEVGPSPTLVSLGLRCVPDDTTWLPSLRKDRDEGGEMLRALASLYVSGVAVNWDGVHAGRRRTRVALPTYPFERQRYWFQSGTVTGPVEPVDRWQRVVDGADRQALEGPLDLRLDTYPARWEALDRLAVEHMVATFRSGGVFAATGEELTPDEVIARCRIQPTYRHLMTRWLDRLCADSLLARSGESRYVSPAPLRDARLDDAWREAKRLNADLPELLAYLERCGRLLGAVLRGTESPLETVFPGGDFKTAEFLYQTWSLPRYFNAIARSVAESMVMSLPRGGSLRVIELGAGSGGTSSALLPALPADRTSYFYTDMSDAFLTRAARKFSAYPFVRYGLFNLEKGPAEQGYPEHAFDLVVAANAIHATKDLGAAIDHVKTLLAPGGVLLLYEVTSHLPWFEMSVGLIEGWERFADELRRENPLLDPARWTRVLEEHGFASVATLPRAGAPATVLGHHIIVALAPDASDAASPREGVSLESSVVRPAAMVEAESGAVREEGSDEFAARFAATPSEDRHDLLVEFVRGHVSSVLRLDARKVVERRQRLMDLGLDSLMAVELRNRLSHGWRPSRPLPATLMFDYPTIDAIATFLESEMSSSTQRSEAVPDAETSEASVSADAIADLSDDEVEAMLLKKLGSL
jgi:acyl transferase domain-containing protein/SAM-dependent methyltransferase